MQIRGLQLCETMEFALAESLQLTADGFELRVARVELPAFAS
jgi:hypothetical protein